MATSDITEAVDTGTGEARRADTAQNQADHSPVDLTGRDRITRNVLASWAAHGVFIVAGFIMPRMIDSRLGQEVLGVWDFGWSLVAYFSLVTGGVTSSVNRYVAKFRAAGNYEGVNRAVSSVSCILALMGLAVVALAVGTALLVPTLLQDRLGEHLGDAQWVVLLLGLSLAVQIAFSVFGGVMTGYHRWGLHNMILAAGHAVKVAGIIVILLLKGGLPVCALAVVLGELAQRMAEVGAAYRCCPGMRLRLSLARWSTVKDMLTFGGKSFVPRAAELLLNQTTAVLLVAYLGPASLALFARPRSLVLHVRTLVTRFAFVLVPTASSMQAMEKNAGLRSLLVDATRYAAFIALPLVLIIAIMGGPLLRLWMGPEYANGWLAALLAVGYLPLLLQLPAINILAGLNAHGRPGLAALIAAICGVGLAVVALEVFQAGLLGAAAAIALPLAVANGIYVPHCVCRRVGIAPARYFLQIMREPLLCAVPFGLCLAAARLTLANSPLAAVVIGLATGGTVLLPLYWRFALPGSIKRRFSNRLQRRRAYLGRSREPKLPVSTQMSNSSTEESPAGEAKISV